jgi:gliding motility-associated-like protein
MATVNILDTVPPSVTCPADITVPTDPGACSVIVTGISATAADNCTVDSITYNLTGATTGSGINDASGGIFNKGVTSVSYKVYDKGGNVDSCNFTVTVTVTSDPPSGANSDHDSICPGDGDITLSYSGGTMTEGGDAQWYDDPAYGNHIGSGNDLVINAPLVITTYYVRFEGICDTTSGTSVTVVVRDLSTAPLSASSDRDTVCMGDGNIILAYSGGSPGSGAVATWYADAAFTTLLGTGNNLTIPAPSVETIYYVRFEGDCDTTDAVQTTVSVYPDPDPQITVHPEVACADGSPVLYVVSGFAGSTFNWSVTGGTITSDLGDSVLVNWGSQVGNYQLTVSETSKYGCLSAPLSLDVQVTVPTVELGDDQTICEGETAIITPSGTFVSLLWMDGTSAASYMADTTEMISILVFDEHSCSAEDSVQVTASSSPVVNLGNDTVLCGGASLVLDAGNAGSQYAWSTGESSQTITVYKERQDISVVVTNEYGCTDEDTISIYECSVKEFFANIPNAFTPNGDNVNDTWYFDEALSFPDIEIEIFDRWGKLVWRSEKGYSEPWDGRSLTGREVPMDSYYYVIELNDGSEQVVGTVTIIR